MPRNTRTYRRSGKAFAPEYAKWVWVEDAPSGVRGQAAGALPASGPLNKRRVKVVLGSGIVERWAVVAPASRA